MSPRYRRLIEKLSVERGLVIGLVIFVLGIVLAFVQVLRWSDFGFGALDVAQTVRVAIPAVLGIVLGFTTIMFSMFSGIMTIPTTGDSKLLRPPVEVVERAEEFSPRTDQSLRRSGQAVR